MPKRVLFTGHGGFVGHHCLEYFLEKTDWEIICIDSFRHKGDITRVKEVVGPDPKNNLRVKTFIHDLTVPFSEPLKNLIFERKINERGVVESKPIHMIINMASESAVERSTTEPVGCLHNNWHLAMNMLEFARECEGLTHFFQVSTDEVYGEAPPNGAHKEWDVICPSNPYAASKAAQEAMAISYWRTYGVPVIITNTMNIIGERQNPEKFLPKIIAKIATNQKMPIYGEPGNIGSRVYLYAKNMADSLVFLSDKPVSSYKQLVADNNTADARPDRYNVCGDAEFDNLELAQMVAKVMDKELNYELIPSESARPGYDRRYALDGSKLREMGWEAPFTMEKTLEKIVNWSLENPHWII